MRPAFLLCVSQQPNDVPYQFKVTGLHVYSFEEVLYHVYHHWKQSVDDFLSDELIAWVNDTLGLTYLAARMKELARTDNFSARLLAFLRLVDYFDDGELDRLRKELTQWEKRLEWEKLKERADYAVERGDPEKALTLYRRALQFGENTALLNNMGVAYMQLEAYEDAYRLLARARALSPEDVALGLRFAEAAIYDGRYDEAQAVLAKAQAQADARTEARTEAHAEARTEARPQPGDIPFLQGVMRYARGDYPESIAYFEKAIAQQNPPEPFYVYRLADVYLRMRQFDQAMAVLEQVADKDVAFFVKQAELHAAAGNMPAAVKAIQKAIYRQSNEAVLWTQLAMYHRLDYNLSAANMAIMKALSLDPENERTKLENARIKKGMGRTKEYQSVLNSILRDFKRKYRELG